MRQECGTWRDLTLIIKCMFLWPWSNEFAFCVKCCHLGRSHRRHITSHFSFKCKCNEANNWTATAVLRLRRRLHEWHARTRSLRYDLYDDELLPSAESERYCELKSELVWASAKLLDASSGRRGGRLCTFRSVVCEILRDVTWLCSERSTLNSPHSVLVKIIGLKLHCNLFYIKLHSLSTVSSGCLHGILYSYCSQHSIGYLMLHYTSHHFTSPVHSDYFHQNLIFKNQISSEKMKWHLICLSLVNERLQCSFVIDQLRDE